MLENVLKEYFTSDFVIKTQEYDLKFEITDTKKAFFGSSYTFEVKALVILWTNEINFQQLMGHILKTIDNIKNKRLKHLICTWIVGSERGGIYLYEEIATKENLKYNGFKNHFVIINTDDGSVSFGPGHIKNKAFSDRIHLLIEKYKMFSRDVWQQEFNKILDMCYAIARIA